MLLVLINISQKSVLRNKFLILVTYHPGMDVTIRCYFSKPKGVREQTNFGKHCSRLSEDSLILSH